MRLRRFHNLVGMFPLTIAVGTGQNVQARDKHSSFEWCGRRDLTRIKCLHIRRAWACSCGNARLRSILSAGNRRAAVVNAGRSFLHARTARHREDRDGTENNETTGEEGRRLLLSEGESLATVSLTQLPPGHGSARLLAIFRRKLCVGILCSLSRDAGKFGVANPKA
jgi:hypothetical protein